MGIGPRISSSAFDAQPVVPLPGNPDPHNYEVIRYTYHQGFLIIELRYPDCTNYEGRKILTYAPGVEIKHLMEQGVIDPHFSESEILLHPIARFEPSERGWAMAHAMCQGVHDVYIEVYGK